MKTFRQILSAAMLLCLCVVFSACPDSEPETDKDYYVNVDQSTVSFGANGGSTTVLVKSNTSWKITGIPDWLSVSPTSGANDAAVTLSTAASNTTRNCTLTISTGEASATINVTQSSGTVPPGPGDGIVGTWFGDIDDDSSMLSFKSDGTAILIITEENAMWRYTYSKKDDKNYTLRISQRPQGYGDDLDQLRVEYVNSNKLLVYTDFGDGDDDQIGSFSRSQPPYIGVWMMEELDDDNDDYWVCYQVINADGTGIYQEFDCKLYNFRVTENEYAPFTWTLTNNGNALRVKYNDGGDYETWDISGINGNIWNDDGDIAYKQTDYTDNPSITGTWKWTYYDESIELVLNSSKTGTYKYWDDNRLSESYSFSYTHTSTSLTLTSSQGTRVFTIALLTYNRMVASMRNDKGEVIGMVFKKQ